jgi:CheY-like chemotaxis protein
MALLVLKCLGYRTYIATNGLEAARNIRARWPDMEVKILDITACALEGDRDRRMAAGMDGYITKPIKLEELKAALEGLNA